MGSHHQVMCNKAQCSVNKEYKNVGNYLEIGCLPPYPYYAGSSWQADTPENCTIIQGQTTISIECSPSTDITVYDIYCSNIIEN
jgi:hypothetical protein